MTRLPFWVLFVGLAGVCLFTPLSWSQPAPPTTRLEPLAETKLIMEGMTKPNFDGLTKTLKEKPTESDSWTFARGQALLVGESANLLMIRPPKGNRAAQEEWLARSLALREAGTKMARAAASKDYLASRGALADLANTCNRCHESFRVATRVDPLGQ